MIACLLYGIKHQLSLQPHTLGRSWVVFTAKCKQTRHLVISVAMPAPIPLRRVYYLNGLCAARLLSPNRPHMQALIPNPLVCVYFFPNVAKNP
jgi:hypothetical protein